MSRLRFCLFLVLTAAFAAHAAAVEDLCGPGQVLLPESVVVRLPAQPNHTIVRMANLLVSRVAEKSQISWQIASSSSSSSELLDQPMFEVNLVVKPENPHQVVPEKYRISTISDSTAPGLVSGVNIIGDDLRGLTFGIGRFLRLLNASWIQTHKHPIKRFICIAPQISISTSPHYAVRGHQIAYRALADCYAGWSYYQMERYIEDLIIFGTNTIEVTFLGRSPSPHFIVPPAEMLLHMSRVCDEFGIDFVLFYASDTKEDPTFSLIKRFPRLNAVFVPGGDPGDLEPLELFHYTHELITTIRQYHPQCQLWISPQAYNASQINIFYRELEEHQEQYATWLTGVVYGPHIRETVHQVRKRLPARFPIRFYPDICHGVKAQYPNPMWGPALGLTEQREVIIPRAKQFAGIIQMELPPTIGFVTYSDGIVDDVNKIVWNILGWDPSVSFQDALVDYASTLIDPLVARHVATGAVRLEENWFSKFDNSNTFIGKTLEHFETLLNSSDALPPRIRKNWRWTSLAFRAYLDQYILSRYIYDQRAEREALSLLARYPSVGSIVAIQDASRLLQTRSDAITAAVGLSHRIKLLEYAALLFESINLELSISPAYQSIGVGRGAVLDLMDNPLNNRLWLQQRFSTLLGKSEPERIEGVRQILGWTDPGPGGFYDDLGSIYNEPHLVRGAGWGKDPSFRATALDAPWEPFYPAQAGFPVLPFQWYYYAEAFYDQPLQMHYASLDPSAQYEVTVVYSGDRGRSVKLVANNGIIIHDYMVKPNPPEPLTFTVPRTATRGGALMLSWYGPAGLGKNGRAQQVSEVWLRISK